MKTLRKIFVLGVLLLTNLCAFAETPSVSTIAEAKELNAEKIYFTGELTLQYVSKSTSGFNYFAFDSNNDYVRLRCYYWPDLLGTEDQLYVGNNIKISGELGFLNDANSCLTFDISQATMKTIEITGLGYRQAPQIVTIDELKNDLGRTYNAKFVSIENAKVESVVDFYVSPFPINKIVAGENSIAFTMEGVMTDFPAKANILGYVDYENGEPKLYIPQFDGFVEPVAFDNISGTKHFKGQLGYDNVDFDANVLVTSAQELDTTYIYRIQKHDASGNPSAMQMIVPKSMNLVFAIGDSVALDVKGHYISAIYEECADALDKMSSSVFTAQINNQTAVISHNNPIQLSSYNTVIVTDDEKHWTTYDNCLVTTLKGDVVVNDKFTAAGCIALRLRNEVAGRYDTVLVANTYYEEAGSPTEAIVCGFVGGYQYGETAYTALIPRSKHDFLQEVMEFDNIAAMKAAGPTPSRAISYKINSAMAITGFTSVTDMATIYMVFVQDETGCLQLNQERPSIRAKYKIGDVITGISGFYNGAMGSSYYSDEYGYVLASAPVMELSSAPVEASEVDYVALPVEITLEQLDDSYASQLITIKNVTCKKETIILSTEDKFVPVIRQGGDDWAILSGDYEYAREMASITGVYFLYSKLTNIIPRSQDDIVVEETPVAVDNIVVDKNLFVENSVVYANGAVIEVYDVMGRLVVAGVDEVSVDCMNGAVMIIKTKYSDNTQCVTKMVNR